MGILRGIGWISIAVSYAFAIAVPSNDAAVMRRQDPASACATGPGWASPVLFIGSSGSGGSYVSSCETQWGGDYTPITGIEVWRKGDDEGGRIAGLQFTYASGLVSAVYGNEDSSKYPSASLVLKPGETIRNGVLYGDGGGNWLGHIHLETSSGQVFDAGRDTSNITPYDINVGGGMLLGASIVTNPSDEGGGSDIASMAFLFLGASIDHIAITDISFNADPSGSNSGISPQNVVVGQWYNELSNPVGYGLTPTYAVISSYSYSQTTTNSWGLSFSVEVSGELFGIGGKEDTGFSWTIQKEEATTVATTSSTAVACMASGTLGPNQGVIVTGTYQTGSGSFDYDSTVVVYLKDGTSYSYHEKGTLKNVAYNQCSTTYKPADNANVPNSPGIKLLQRSPQDMITSRRHQLRPQDMITAAPTPTPTFA